MNIKKAIKDAYNWLHNLLDSDLGDKALESKASHVALRLAEQVYTIGLKRLNYTGTEVAEELTRRGVPTSQDTISRCLYAKQTVRIERLVLLKQLYEEAIKLNKSKGR